MHRNRGRPPVEMKGKDSEGEEGGPGPPRLYYSFLFPFFVFSLWYIGKPTAATEAAADSLRPHAAGQYINTHTHQKRLSRCVIESRPSNESKVVNTAVWHVRC